MITDTIKLDPNQWEMFLSRGTRQFKQMNSIIYHQGELVEGVYWIEKGLIKITTCSNQGDMKSINIIGPRNFFGELALINEPSITTAVTLKDSVIYFFTVNEIKSLFKDFDESIMIILSSLLQKMIKMAETRFLTTAEQQIAYTLLELSQHYPNRRIHITQKELAEHTGLTRMTLNKILKKWTSSGIIETENKVITIKNANALDVYSRTNII